MVALGASACGPKVALSRVEKEVFTPSCAFATCHLGRSASGGLNLESPTYAKLINVDAGARPGMKLVVPGNPEASWLYQKLVIQSAESMPPGAPLEAERIALVRDWIASGAPND